jgi:ATP-dependent DNA helicase 2 subunit 1
VLSSATVKATTANDGISLLNALISNINSKSVPKRALFSNMTFEIGPGFKISVKGYNVMQHQKPARQSYIWLNGEQAQIAVGESAQMAEDTARAVQKSEIKKAYKFGGEQVLFTKEEQRELKNFGPPGLRIIGFKPQSMLPFWASVDKSTFIYPSEEDYVGSTRVFAALWQNLLKDEKMGLAWYVARVNAKPQLVAILPSRERLDDGTKQQVIPAGLWLYPLPYADDIRNPPEIPPPLVSPDNLVDMMRVVIQQLQLPGAKYEPAKYPNPALQWHYRILQAMALEEEIPEFRDGDDKTIPKYRQIDKRAGEYVVEWGVALEEQCKVLDKEKATKSHGAGVKREADDEKRGASKKAKAGASQTRSSGRDMLGGMSADQLKKQVEDGMLARATVAELRELLSSKGLETKGVKSVLIDRIEEWLEEQ